MHIIGPEQGFTLPGATVVCGDSHTSTHGAFGALAFGIGTSEVEHVLATQTIITQRSKNMRVQVDGKLAPGVSSKDIILHVIGAIGTAGGTGAVIEYCGSAIRGLSMEARMSICNMSIEAGARAGMVAPDQTTIDYLRGRPLAPKPDDTQWDRAVAYWLSLKSDEDAAFDLDLFIDCKDIAPTVSWGTSPQDVVPITGLVPSPDDFPDEDRKEACRRALKYMGLESGTRMQDIELDKVFIGSCTNARIEDLRTAGRVVAGKRIAPNLKRAMIVPGSGLVKRQAETEGLDKIFLDAGFEWREAGCSMCLGMNPDILSPGERCASTSNRNFEGRQGAGGRTHLMSPAMAAAAAIMGKIADVRKLAARTGVTQSPKVDLGAHAGEISSDEDWDRVMDAPTSTSATHTSAPTMTLSGMPKFTTLSGHAVPLDIANIDTDAIIPKQFLKTIKRSGLGHALFHSWRYVPASKGSPLAENPSFILNQTPFRSAKVLVCTAPNFGCGSSREHAPWALLDFGIRCIVAPSFGDIFFNNTFKNGMLPIKLSGSPEADAGLRAVAQEAQAGKKIEVNLLAQEIRAVESDRVLAKFDVEPWRKLCLVNGLDDIGITMKKEEEIGRFEERRSRAWPWLDGLGYLARERCGGVLGANAAPVPSTNRGMNLGDPLQW